MLSPRHRILAVPLILLAFSPLWTRILGDFLRPPDTDNLRNAAGQPAANSFVMDGVTIYQHRAGQLELQATMARAHARDSSRAIECEKLSALIRRQGQKTRIAGDHGIWQPADAIFTLTGNVTVKGRDFTGHTPALTYLVRDDLLRTDESVRLENAAATITGTGLIYRMASGDLQVGGRGRVIADFQSPNSR